MDGTRPLDIATKRRKAIGGVKIGSSVAWSHFVRVTIHAAVLVCGPKLFDSVLAISVDFMVFEKWPGWLDN